MRFEALFGRPPAVRAHAPARVNLIGEHTDYNEGFVLPTTLPLGTRVELAVRDDDTVQAWSANVGDPAAPVAYRLGDERRGGDWIDYVKGVTCVAAKAGHRFRGIDLRIESDVPVGSGLASSAALEVALLRALRAAFDLVLDDVPLALLAQRAETDFVGAPVGVMDQMAASLGDPRTALFLDTRALAWRRVPLPDNADLVVVGSGIDHRHAGGEYKVRRAECERAAALLGVAALRDVAEDALSRAAALPEPLERRVRHVVTENARVQAAVAALEAGDVERLGELFVASHESMRADFEASLPAIDFLVGLASADAEVYGARLTGGGFGGAIVVLARRGAGARAGRRLVAASRAHTNRRATLLVPPARSGPAGTSFETYRAVGMGDQH